MLSLHCNWRPNISGLFNPLYRHLCRHLYKCLHGLMLDMCMSRMYTIVGLIWASYLINSFNNLWAWALGIRYLVDHGYHMPLRMHNFVGWKFAPNFWLLLTICKSIVSRNLFSHCLLHNHSYAFGFCHMIWSRNSPNGC